MAKTKTRKAPVAVESPPESEVKKVLLRDLVSNTAQSRGMGVLSKLTSLGYGVFERRAVDKAPLWEMLFSDKPEDSKHAIDLIEENEPELVRLADSVRTAGQLQAIGVIDADAGTLDVVFGMRRAIAAAYNHVRHGTSSEIEARVYKGKMSAVDLKLMALKENDDREQESPIDRAMTYHWLKKVGKKSTSEIAKAVGMSGQTIDNYLKLLDPKLEDRRQDIHEGTLSIDKALKLLVQRKGTGVGAGANRESNGNGRFRLPPVKTIVNIYDSPSKPAKMSDEEWALWTAPDVRKFLAYKLGLKFSEYVIPSANGHIKGGKLLKVKRGRAVDLLICLGKTAARTWSDEILKERLENIPNQMETSDQRVEDASLQKLLDKLLTGYSDGMRVEITADDK